MINQQLLEYVKGQLDQGRSKEEIKKELLGVGWEEKDINESLGIKMPLQNSKPPLPPSFSNSEITSTGLQSLEPRVIWIFFFRFLFFPLFTLGWLAATAGSVLPIGFLPIIIALPLFLGILFCFVWAKLAYHFYHYELAEEGFRKEFGVIYKKYVTIPYERIQNVNIQRNILDRILGLSGLKIFTAGSGMSGSLGAEGFLPGLSKENAEKIRKQLIFLSRQSKSQGF